MAQRIGGAVVCWILMILTLGYFGHRWITISHLPKRELCGRCGLARPPGADDWKTWR